MQMLKIIGVQRSTPLIRPATDSGKPNDNYHLRTHQATRSRATVAILTILATKGSMDSDLATEFFMH